jgi:hypothetical protein
MIRKVKQPRPETTIKLRELAKHLYKNHGIDAKNISNFMILAKKEAGKIGIDISKWTIIANESFLIKCLNSFKKEQEALNGVLNELSKKPEEPEVKIIQSSPVGFIKQIVVKWSDGKESIFVEQVAPLPVATTNVSPGLFNYANNQIIVRLGAYKGADLTSKASIISKFGTWKRYENWLIHQSSPEITQKLNGPTTHKDTMTLLDRLQKLGIYLKNQDKF